ncbi:hypothetical protein BHM03_00037994 [Ensete ventricosum]|nr:hypothetical protein BHM03_00037994 [Ensete ventricosum]
MEKHPRPKDEPEITFLSGEVESPNHDDSLVILARIGNAWVKRIMVDTESSIDVLYFGAFQKLSQAKKDLIPMTSTITKFTRDSISPLGTTTILVTIGEEPRYKTMMVIFRVVRLSLAYNAILDHPTLNKLRAVVSTYHWTMKFPTRVRVGDVRSDPRESR